MGDDSAFRYRASIAGVLRGPGPFHRTDNLRCCTERTARIRYTKEFENLLQRNQVTDRVVESDFLKFPFICLVFKNIIEAQHVPPVDKDLAFS